MASVDSAAVSVGRKYSYCNFSTNTLPAQPHQFVFTVIYSPVYICARLSSSFFAMSKISPPLFCLRRLGEKTEKMRKRHAAKFLR